MPEIDTLVKMWNSEDWGADLPLPTWIEICIIYGGLIGVTSAIVLYYHRSFADPLYSESFALLMGLVFWIVCAGVFAWTFRKIVFPAFATA